MTALVGGVLLAAGVMLYLVEPFFSGRGAAAYRGADEHDERAARRRVALTALRDLEYDRATGKLDATDYRQLRAELSRDALRLLGPGGGDQGDGAPAPSSDRRVERASRELEAEISQIRRALRDGLQCEDCGRINRAGARFCSGCGDPLGRAQNTGAGAGATGASDAAGAPGAASAQPRATAPAPDGDAT